MTERRPYSYAGAIAFALFVASVWVANLLVENVGASPAPDAPHLIDVGFGLQAPSAVLAVGVAFTLRDIIQRELGRAAVIVAIIIGASLSMLISPAFAIASGVAFLVSELADFAVYTPLEEKSWTGAIVLSNTVGALIDSWIFLTIAFGSLEFFWGQVVGKMWMTLAAMVLIVAWRARRGVLARYA